MLLSLMRKHATSLIIKIMIAMIALFFILSYGYSYISQEANKIAEVNGKTIGQQEYDNVYRDLVTNLQNQYKSVWSDKLIEAFDLENRALESIIEKIIIKQEAERIGLKVTKNEIRQEILSIPAFQTNGMFDENKYRSILSYNHMKPEEFEANRSHDMLQNKLIQFLMAFLLPSDQDIQDNYKYSNEKIKLSFIKFSPDEYKSEVKIEESLLESFFNEKKEDYRIPDKIKISYIRVNPAEFSDEVKLEEEELINYYEDNLDMFTEEKEIRARHILFELPPDAAPEKEKEVKEKAAVVLEKAKQGEDFAKLAEEYSEGPTKANGGDLGYFKKGTMYDEFEASAFSLEMGEIGDLVKSPVGYHIIKVEDIKENPVIAFDEVRDQIVSIMTQNRSMDLANEKVLSLMDQMPYDIDLTEYASQHNVPAENTNFFTRFDPPELFQGNSKLMETLFALESKDVTDEVIEINNEYYIIQILDKKPSYLPELNEVMAEVEVDYVDNMALKRAKEEAEKYLQELKEGKGWTDLAMEKGRIPESTNYFSRLDFPDKIGSAPGIHEAAFKLDVNSPYPDKVFDNYSGAFVIKFEEKQQIDENKFNEEKNRYAGSLMMRKRQELFSSWIERIKAKSDIDRSYFDSKRN